ncbi:hypothetical protein Q8A73_016584 [Channa argus]|nr:hypothetical protein Q8A73_016584 [Channa argus]
MKGKRQVSMQRQRTEADGGRRGQRPGGERDEKEGGEFTQDPQIEVEVRQRRRERDGTGTVRTRVLREKDGRTEPEGGKRRGVHCNRLRWLLLHKSRAKCPPTSVILVCPSDTSRIKYHLCGSKSDLRRHRDNNCVSLRGLRPSKDNLIDHVDREGQTKTILWTTREKYTSLFISDSLCLVRAQTRSASTPISLVLPPSISLHQLQRAASVGRPQGRLPLEVE